MVNIEVLEEALRGGEQARILEEKCRNHLAIVEETVRQVVDTAPDFIESTRSQHQVHLSEAEALVTQLEMLGESLDDITRSYHEMLQRTERETARRKALDDLASTIEPFVHVADALNRSENISNFSFQQLEATLATLQSAMHIAVQSNWSVLKRSIPELEERSDQVKVTMKSRYMDLFEICPNSIMAKLRTSDGTEINAEAASKSMSNVDLLKDAIENIVSELLRRDVATSLARATVCFENETDSAYVMEWSEGTDDSGELLEFDLDDLEASTDSEVDAMTDNLDIGNAAARALKVYDVLRLKVFGETFSRDLAFALQSWLCNHVLASSVVLATRRTVSNMPKEMASNALHSRVAAVSASARAIQAAIRARGVPSFVLIVEMDALESKVGSECRAQAVLRTRRAIATFAAAAHDNDEIVECPISADRYIPQEKRPPEYFAPCLVTRTAIAVHDAFLSTRRDAVNAARGGSLGIAAAMNAAALECLRAYREDVPVQYSDELRASLRLKALYFTDCTMFAHSCKLSVEEGAPEASDFMEEFESLEAAAQKAMISVRRTAERRLDENLDAACRNGALGAYGTLTRIQRSSALSAAFHAMREVVSVFAQIVPTELAEIAACRLLEKYLSKLCREVVQLPEISAEGCSQIDGILRDADRNVAILMKLVNSMEVVRAGALPPPAVQQMRTIVARVHAIREILNAKMEEIVTSYQSGKFDGLVSRQEVEHFIRAIFEDSELRASFITTLDTRSQQETSDWDNSNW